jgi:hypothetical protein
MKACMFAVAAVLIATAGYATPINGGTSVNANGTVYEDFSGGGSTPLSIIPGMNTAAWNPASGLGSFVYTDTGTGARFFDVFINLDLGNAFWNEYASTSGSPASGETWQADTPDFDCDANRCGNIIFNADSNALDNTNHIPGQVDNYLIDCGADGGGTVNLDCNNDVALALGFSYSVPAGDQALLTFNVSTTAPATGFFLRQIKPLDGDNDPQTVYFSGNVTIQQQAVPEPGTLILLGSGLTCLIRSRRRIRDVQPPKIETAAAPSD